MPVLLALAFFAFTGWSAWALSTPWPLAIGAIVSLSIRFSDRERLWRIPCERCRTKEWVRLRKGRWTPYTETFLG